jgi:two-component system chemotaxis sensor kinase CheA
MDNDLLQVFVQESREHLDHLEPDLLSLENNRKDTELVNRIFRAIHSIKGASGFFGLRKVLQLSHAMENLMSRVRESLITPEKPLVDALLAGTDKLRTLVDDVDHSNEADIDHEIQTLQTLLTGTAGTAVPPPKPPSGGGQSIDRSLIEHARKKGHYFYKVQLFTHKDIKDKGKTPLDYFKKIESLGQFLDSYTDISDITGMEDALQKDLVCVFLFSTVLEKDLMVIAMEIPEQQITQLTAEQLISEGPLTPPAEKPIARPESIQTSAAPATPEPPAPEPTASMTLQKNGTRSKSDETIRVSVALLDDLMNIAGEMVLGRNQLLRSSETMARNIPGMHGLLQNISLVTSDLQEKVMRTRLQPVGTIFGKFTRIIRDMSHQLGKKIDLKISGEEVEFDKSILEMLSDPLTHLIRNCADHGIETPLERERDGKPLTGTIHLAARHIGGQVHIEVTDDGRGLDAIKLKKKAVEKGLLKAQDTDQMSDRQAFNLIFLPGFSTAEKITDISGRGVGMDVVRNNIEKLGGTIDLDSQRGQGTRICLRLPLTLAIIPTMIVGLQHRRFAVPQVNLEEIVRLGRQNRIERVRGVSVMRLRGKLLPLVALADILDLHEPSEDGDVSTDEGYALVLKVGDNRFGLMVRELFDSEEIVVKPLSSYLKNCKCYSGATIMGDGKVAMILDAGGIANLAHLQFGEMDQEAAALALQEHTDISETQSLLIFRNAGDETFAINVVMVSRIEKIRAKDIERIGQKEVLKYRNSSLRLIRLHDFMPVSRPDADPEFLYVIVPKLVRHPLGIVVTQVLDTVQTSVLLDEANVTGPGILGSAVINNKLTIFLNIYSLFEAADPENYREKTNIPSLSDKRILLAEDTAFFRAIMTQYLKEFNCVFDVAQDGLEAWEALNRQKYDLLLTDIEMPGLNGFELTQKVRTSEKLKRLPVVALTSLAADHYVQQGREAGVDAYEIKLDKERLRAILELMLLSGSHPKGLPMPTSTAHADHLVNLEEVPHG